ncbi:peptidylprolyl isomerase [Sediminibacterium roseum]|uniref:Peptidylprolyl isomerase n=1 Tax=Sediminibacterium roseum TaxID=1978412 RepID=A0ABW9ZWN1_9BACT|nr:peptidylprolyl isomerase [Sediminibacterium roseum]NCI51429.1 peptidylprolyl isomerase [Sediminibacterium roseum]
MKPFFLFAIILVLSACGKPLFRERWLKQKAPAHFTARFETSKGNIDAEFTREWSPLAVDRLYTQIKHGTYDHILFYRVVPNFVAQFGTDDSTEEKLWKNHPVPDEPVKQGNDRGTIAFARSGKNTRGIHLFINLRNNNRLDTITYSGVTGFPVLGKVTAGMEVADTLYKGYGDKVFAKYDSMFISKKVFLERFPLLDSIKRIYITGKRK